jgi:2-keto-4-pentenoate hydratase/2-oxohepta-3-ene-1,7-dioic acid hydratase in catechol pathway
MKLIRYGNIGSEKPGVIINDAWYDVSEYIHDYDEKFFESDGLGKLKTIVSEKTLKEVSRDIRLGSPVARPSKIICIGLNYSDHATESKMQLPSEPVIFFKATTAVVGPNDNLIIPKNSVKTDWEVELAVVMRKKASYVDEAVAMNYVAGYMLHNDYSEREFQLERAGQWVKGKSCDTFAPLGPYLATQDEISDVNDMRLWLTVNGKMMQDGNTKNLVFKIPHLISYLSQFMTLLPGDIISTGTPAGVGLGQKPEPVYIKPGDVIELGIHGLGSSRQVAVSYSNLQV